ncbi:MAG: formylglycine-generating enzyme family protein, partial [Proteobacteria bacterium]|nr:formylglycine-generating enzyme family protein [Pseudomonadota bacterium]
EDLEIIEEIESDNTEEEAGLGAGKDDGSESYAEGDASAIDALETADGINEDTEDIEIIEEIEPEDIEEDVGLGGEGGDSADIDSNAKIFEEDFDISETKPLDNKAKFLAEEFNHSLAAMDKYYNQYILIPEGAYIIGSKRPKKGESLEKAVDLPAYYIGKYPITNALFEVFVEKTGYKTTAEKRGYGKVYFGRYEKTIDEKTGMEKLLFNATTKQNTVKGACWYQPSGPGSMIHKKRNHPVVQISLEDAMAFASWTGKRLPTEDEWEAASRTAKGNLLPWGNKFKKEACNIEDSSICGTTSVENYHDFENKFGLVDMLGNVFEWTSSRIDKFMIGKGGCWISGVDIRLFSRLQLEPDGHSNILGFRCVAY